MSEESVLFVCGRDIGQVITAYCKAIEDDHISIGEWLTIGAKGGEAVFNGLKNFKALKAAIFDGVDLMEQGEFKEGLLEGFDLVDDVKEEQIEELVSEVVGWLGSTARLVGKARGLIKAK